MGICLSSLDHNVNIPTDVCKEFTLRLKYCASWKMISAARKKEVESFVFHFYPLAKFEYEPVHNFFTFEFDVLHDQNTIYSFKRDGDLKNSEDFILRIKKEVEK